MMLSFSPFGLFVAWIRLIDYITLNESWIPAMAPSLPGCVATYVDC